MNQKKEIKLLKGGKEYQVTALLETDDENRCKLQFDLPDESISVQSWDFFGCLEEIKKQYPDILMYCKGYKRNVYPSRMAREMSSGLSAYEMTLGKPAQMEDLVKTFDYEEQNLTASNEEQEDFRNKWFASLQK